MRYLKAVFAVSCVLVVVGCTPTQENPNGWHRIDGNPIEHAAASASIKKCDFIRASRKATVDPSESSFLDLVKARECMKNEGYELKK